MRLDSAAEDDERATAWRALTEGRARLAVGTRSALLAPLATEGLLALVDEHEPAHKPPGARKSAEKRNGVLRFLPPPTRKVGRK